MNYQKIYDAIIERAKSEDRNKTNIFYYENHHILPRCLGGTNKKVNLVLLTAREHYVCHKLLHYIYHNSRGLCLAFFRMTFDKIKNRKISSRDYAYAKELLNLIPVSKETKLKMSINSDHRGEKNPMFGKKQSNESKEKNRLSHIGKAVNGPLSGKTRLGKKREKYKLKMLICIYCNKDFSTSSHTRWHGDNCKSKINI